MFLFVKHKCQRVHLRVSIGFDILLITLNDDKEETLDLNSFLLILSSSLQRWTLKVDTHFGALFCFSSSPDPAHLLEFHMNKKKALKRFNSKT